MEQSTIKIFFTPPSDFDAKVEIAVVWVVIDEYTLFLQKARTSKYAPLQWAPVGGKIDVGEDPLLAAIRETEEEAGIKLDTNEVYQLAKLYVRDPKLDFIYFMYHAPLAIKPVIRLSDEHIEYQWIKLLDALKLDLMVGVKETIDIYKNVL